MIWKFPHAQSDPMFPTQKIECPAIHSDYWVMWIKVDKPSRQLLMNCEEAIVILDEQDYKLKYNFKVDFRHSLPFTACAFYHPSCYFITGEFCGRGRSQGGGGGELFEKLFSQNVEIQVENCLGGADCYLVVKEDQTTRPLTTPDTECSNLT